MTKPRHDYDSSWFIDEKKKPNRIGIATRSQGHTQTLLSDVVLRHLADGEIQSWVIHQTFRFFQLQLLIHAQNKFLVVFFRADDGLMIYFRVRHECSRSSSITSYTHFRSRTQSFFFSCSVFALHAERNIVTVPPWTSAHFIVQFCFRCCCCCCCVLLCFCFDFVRHEFSLRNNEVRHAYRELFKLFACCVYIEIGK